MRTLVVIHSLKLGGMERVAVNLADGFANQGHDSHLLCLKSIGEELRPSEPSVHLHRHHHMRRLMASGIGIPVFLLSRLLLGLVVKRSHYLWTGWLGGWLFGRHLAAIEKRYGRFDRIVFRGLGTFKYLWGWRDERACYVLENILPQQGPEWHQRLQGRVLFHGRHLVAVSDGVRESAEAAFRRLEVTPASMRMITNPCPVAQIRADADRSDPDIPDSPYVLNVARLVPQKGHDLLIDAYAQANPKEKLVIVGDGPKREALQRQIARLGLDGRVVLAGRRSNPYPWMKRARLFVLSSEYEGLGIVLLESLACGTPVLSVDCPGGVRTVLCGELEQALAPHSAAGLAARLTQVLAAPPETVSEHVLGPFRTETVVARFLETPA